MFDVYAARTAIRRYLADQGSFGAHYVDDAAEALAEAYGHLDSADELSSEEIAEVLADYTI